MIIATLARSGFIVAFSASGQNSPSSFYTIQEYNFCAKCQQTNMAQYDIILTSKKIKKHFEKEI